MITYAHRSRWCFSRARSSASTNHRRERSPLRNGRCWKQENVRNRASWGSSNRWSCLRWMVRLFRRDSIPQESKKNYGMASHGFAPSVNMPTLRVGMAPREDWHATGRGICSDSRHADLWGRHGTRQSGRHGTRKTAGAYMSSVGKTIVGPPRPASFSSGTSSASSSRPSASSVLQISRSSIVA